MKLTLRKYFVPILSFLLILSNFSYAADIMMCGMMSEAKVKCCCNDSKNEANGAAFSKVRKSCCDSRTIELSNSTHLLNLKNEISCDVKSFDLQPGVCNLQPLTCTSQNLSDKLKLPEDIPILISSLLI